MNLLQTITAIEKTAALQPSVGTIVRQDIFRLNAAPVVQYGVVAWLQGEHTTNADSGLITYNFTLFYVDRLTENKGNEVEVQSQALETLGNIISALEGLGLYAESCTYTTFTQRFADECAGAFVRVAFETTKDTLCAEAYDFLENDADYSLDFNEDFKIWQWVQKERTIYFI